MSFSYNPIDVGAVERVQVTESSASRTSDQQPTQEQKRKQQLIRLLADDFGAFAETFEKLLMARHTEEPRDIILNILGIPEYKACENCDNLRSGVCYMYVDEGGERVDITTPQPQPGWCETEEWSFNFPTHLLDDVADHVPLPDAYDYKQDLENRDWGEGVDKPTYKQWLASEVDRRFLRLVRVLDRGGDRDAFRGYAIRAAWFLHLDDVVNEDYHRLRAEAYLREMGHRASRDAKIGEGGVEFEEEVREMFQAVGFPLYPRNFSIETKTGRRRKEMDIHTEIGEYPLIAEVYTQRADHEKATQLENYGELYEVATGEVPLLMRITDSTHDVRLTTGAADAMAAFDRRRVPGGLVPSPRGYGRYDDIEIVDKSGSWVFRGESCWETLDGDVEKEVDSWDVVDPEADQSCLTPDLFLDLLVRITD